MEKDIFIKNMLAFGYKKDTINKQLNNKSFPTLRKAIQLEENFGIPVKAWKDIKSFLNNESVTTKENKSKCHKKENVS